MNILHISIFRTPNEKCLPPPPYEHARGDVMSRGVTDRAEGEGRDVDVRAECALLQRG